MYEALAAKKKVICQRSGHLLPQQFPWPKSSMERFGVTYKSTNMCPGKCWTQNLCFGESRTNNNWASDSIHWVSKAFNQTDLLFPSPTKRGPNLIMSSTMESGSTEEKNWSHSILLSRIGMNSIDLSII